MCAKPSIRRCFLGMPSRPITGWQRAARPPTSDPGQVERSCRGPVRLDARQQFFQPRSGLHFRLLVGPA